MFSEQFSAGRETFCISQNINKQNSIPTMAEKIQNEKRILELQGEVANLRMHGPKIISNILQKEGELTMQNLKESQFSTGRKQDVDFEAAKKPYSYITKSLLDVQKPNNQLEKQIALNMKVDTLNKCIEYLKK